MEKIHKEIITVALT